MDFLQLGIQIDTNASQASSDLDKLDASTKRVAADAKLMTQAFGPKITVPNANDVFGPIITGATTAKVAAAGFSAEMVGASDVTRAFREDLHVLHPLLLEAGAGFGGLGAFAGAARAGIIGLVAAVTGGLIIGLAKAGDEAITTQKKLTDLTGSQQVGAQTMNTLKAAADNLGVSVEDLVGPYRMVYQLQQQINAQTKGIVWAPDTAGAVANLKNVGDAVVSLSNYYRIADQDSKKFGTDLSATFGSVFKSGKLTAETFQQIRDVSDQAATAIAKGFNANSAAEFEERLKVLPASAQEFLNVLVKLGPAGAAAFQQSGIGAGTTAGAFDKLWASTQKIWQSFGQASGAGKETQGVLNDVADAVVWLTNAHDKNVAATTKEEAALMQLGSTYGTIKLLLQGFMDLGVWDFLKTVWDDIKTTWDTATAGLIADVKQLYDDLTSIFNFKDLDLWNFLQNVWSNIKTGWDTAIDGMISDLKALYNDATSIVNSIITLINNVLGVFRSAKDAGGSGAGGGGEGVQYVPTDDSGGADYLPGFASGVQFKIPGADSSVDSVPVSFMGAPGETVTVTPAGQTPPNVDAMNSGAAGSGLDLGAISGESSIIDASSLSPGQNLEGTADSLSAQLGKLGITNSEVGSAVTGAGNNKVQDVIREGNIQIISQMIQDANNIIAQIQTTDTDIVTAINNMSAAVSSAATSSKAGATASTAAATVSASSGGGGGGGGGKSSGDITADYNNSMNKLDQALAGGPPGSQNASNNPAAAAKTPAGATPAPDAAPAQQGTIQTRDVGTSPLMGTGAMPGAKTAPTLPGAFDSEGSGNIFDTAWDQPSGGNSDALLSTGGYIDVGNFATGGGIDIPDHYPNDSFQMQMNVESGERVKVYRRSEAEAMDQDKLMSGNSNPSGSPVKSIYIVTNDAKSFSKSEPQVTQQLRRMLTISQKAG